jgi:GNAT superfamily N-acetyltransferase
MDPAAYIIELQKTESNALGFIPAPYIRDYLIPREQYLIQTDHLGFARGYLLHGPPKPQKPLRIYQTCVDIDHRRILYATRMVQTLIARARNNGATALILRCAATLPANQFWLAMGFTPIKIDTPPNARKRPIITYQFDL